MSATATVIWTILIIAASAFFVGAEFALMAARPHRLEDAATKSVAGRAALRNASELSLLLAGSQLGITICTLALGAITKPAVHHALTPLLELTGLPHTAADVAAFVLALFIVTFVHLVVGEMAPKSWAIAHPERSAVLLALPMRGFMFLFRPLLRALNSTAIWLVKVAGAEPVTELSSGQDAAGLRQLVEHSASVGALDVAYRRSMTTALTLSDMTVADTLPRSQRLTAVPSTATFADVQRATMASGHMRVLLRAGQSTVGVVHVRDTLQITDPRTPALQFARTPLVVEGSDALTATVQEMRRTRSHLAIVRIDGTERGLVTLEDMLPRLIPT